MNEFISVVKKYAVFSGRARRKEFWMYVLFYVIIAVVLCVVDAIIGIPLLYTIFALAMLPLIGALVLIIFWVMDSNPGDNQYGPSPKAAA